MRDLIGDLRDGLWALSPSRFPYGRFSLAGVPRERRVEKEWLRVIRAGEVAACGEP